MIYDWSHIAFYDAFCQPVASRSTDLCHVADIANIRDRALVNTTTPISMVKMWGDGFWNLLAFGMQMALIIVTGHALASSAPVKSLLRTAASAAKTPVQGVMLVTFFGSVACVINWGFGLVVGAMFAREVARRVPGSDYPLLIACAYIGFLTWGGGFSGSMPLLAATPGNPVEHIAGLIPVGDTLFSGFNIFITVTLIVVMPFITRMMMPNRLTW